MNGYAQIPNKYTYTNTLDAKMFFPTLQSYGYTYINIDLV